MDEYFECEDEETRHLVRAILELFPAKKHLSQSLADLLLHYNARHIQETSSLEVRLAELRLQGDEQRQDVRGLREDRVQALSERIAALQDEVASQEKEVRMLSQLDRQQQAKCDAVKREQSMAAMLSESQADLQGANKQLETMMLAN